MLATYVNAHQVKLTLDEAALAFRVALAAVLGEDPSPPTLALALAKTALETGRWGISGGLWNFNFGNIKCSDKWPGLFTCISLNEVGPAGVSWYSPEGLLNRKGGTVIAERSVVPPGHPQTRMRAFQTASEGALDYCRFVAGGRYKGAWALLLEGDAAGYVHALKQAGYFTADEATYAKGVVSLHKEFLAKLSGLPHDEPTVEVPHPDVVRGWLSPQDVAQLEAELDDRYFDLLDMNRRDALREIHGLDEDEEVTVVDGPRRA